MHDFLPIAAGKKGSCYYVLKGSGYWIVGGLVHYFPELNSFAGKETIDQVLDKIADSICFESS